MMSMDELQQLFRETAGREMLSVYLPARPRDPAMRAEARTLFNAGASRLRKSLDAAPRERREALEAALAHAQDALDGAAPLKEGDAVALFAADSGVRHVGPLFAPTPAVMEWRDGVVVAPYVRSLTRARPAFLVVLDSRAARLYRFHATALERLASLASDVAEEAPSRLGEVPAGPFHHGTRGGTATDELARREHAAFERMLADAVVRLQAAVPPDAWVIVGGIPRTASDFVAALPKSLAPRAHLATHLTMQSREPELVAVVAEEASALTRARDAELAGAVLDRAAANGRATAGWNATRRALAAKAVQQLLVSATWLEQSPGRAEEAVRLAFDGGAAVEVVAGPGAERLDASAEGIAASLRFPVPETDRATRGAAMIH